MEDSIRSEDHQIGRVVSVAADFAALPVDCVANILSLTTPLDAGRLASVSRTFRFAADSDAVWNRFLPSDYQTFISRSGSDPAVFSRKKDLFLSLCQNPILIDDGIKSFSLDKESGKKCFMLAARDLGIVWGDIPQYMGWTSLTESRFAEVAQLIFVVWLEIRGKICIRMLSPATTYAAYLIFKMDKGAYGFGQSVKVSVGTTVGESHEQTVCLKPAGKERPKNQVSRSGMIGSSSLMQNEEPDENRDSDNDEMDKYVRPIRLETNRCFIKKNKKRRPNKYSYRANEWERNTNSEYEYGVEGLQRPKERRDGWLEIELGEVFNGEGEDGDMEMSIMETLRGNSKTGLIIEGIEVRPKQNRS